MKIIKLIARKSFAVWIICLLINNAKSVEKTIFNMLRGYSHDHPMLVMGLINSSIPRLSKASTIAKMLKLIPDSKPKRVHPNFAKIPECDR